MDRDSLYTRCWTQQFDERQLVWFIMSKTVFESFTVGLKLLHHPLRCVTCSNLVRHLQNRKNEFQHLFGKNAFYQMQFDCSSRTVFVLHFKLSATASQSQSCPLQSPIARKPLCEHSFRSVCTTVRAGEKKAGSAWPVHTQSPVHDNTSRYK